MRKYLYTAAEILFWQREAARKPKAGRDRQYAKLQYRALARGK